jgi:nucleotide-binding universal stress UspA family protein
MNDGDGSAPFRRILVAMDSSPESRAALEVAAGLAASLRSELAGLFVEDQDLFDLAALPFSREIPLTGAMSRNFDPVRLGREVRAQMALAKRAFEAEATRRRLAWSFEVVRGRIERELTAWAQAADLIALAKAEGGQSVPGRAARAAMARRAGAVLVVGRRPAAARNPITVPFGGSVADERVLAIAAAIARAQDSPLEVLLHGGDDRAIAALEGQALKVLAGRPPPTLRKMPGDAAQVLGRCLCEIHRKLIVLPAGIPPFEDERIERLVMEAPSPLLLVRAERG